MQVLKRYPEAPMPSKYRVHLASQQKVFMSPRRFVGLTLPKHQGLSRRKINKFKTAMLVGKSLDPLRLELNILNNQVLRHDGRHRAIAAHELHIKKVPVIVYEKVVRRGLGRKGKFIDEIGHSAMRVNPDKFKAQKGVK